MPNVISGGALTGPVRQADLGYADNYVRDQVMELYTWSRNEHEQRYCHDWYFYYRLFMNYVDRRVSTDDYRSNFGLGLAFPIIELLHARAMEAWMGGTGILEAEAEQQAGEDKAPRVSAYANYVLQKQVKRSFAKHSLMKKSALIFGRGIMKPYIRYMPPAKLLRRIPLVLRGMLRLGSYLDMAEVPAAQRLDFGYVDPFDWWMTPGARFLDEDADWTFERGYITTSKGHERQESGEWNSKVPIYAEDALGFDQWHLKRMTLESGYGFTDQVRAQQGKHKPLHRVIEFQGRLETKETRGSKPKYSNRVVQLLDENYMPKNRELLTWNGRPGYLTWEPTLNPAAVRPIGVIEPMEDILLELNDYENIALDNARKALETPLFVDPASTKQRKFYLGPREINWVRNPRQNVWTPDGGDLPRSFYNQIGFLNDLVQRISGVSDYFGGMNTADTDRLSQTATGMQLMANLSASRFGPMIGSLDRDYYRGVGEWIHETAKLWQSTPVELRMPGNPSSPFTTVAPDDMDAEFTFHFNTNTLDPTSEQRRQNYIAMVKTLHEMSEGMLAQGKRLNYYEAARILMQEFGRGAEVGRLIENLPGLLDAPGFDPTTAALAGMYGPRVPGFPGAQPGNAGTGVPRSDVPGTAGPGGAGPGPAMPPSPTVA